MDVFKYILLVLIPFQLYFKIFVEENNKIILRVKNVPNITFVVRNEQNMSVKLFNIEFCLLLISVKTISVLTNLLDTKENVLQANYY